MRGVEIDVSIAAGAGIAEGWEGLIVICAGTAWKGGWSSERHIAAHLSRSVPVLYVDPPSSPVARLRGGSKPETGLRVIDSRLAVLTPTAMPGQSRPLMRGATAALTRQAIARALASMNVTRPKALVVANHIDLFGAVDAEARVLYATDDFVAGAELLALDRRYMKAEQRGQAAHADQVIVVSDQLADKWRTLGHDPVLIPNGCDATRFDATDEAPWPEDVVLPSPIAAVFGHLSHRIDMSLLEAVVNLGISLLLVGTVERGFSIETLLPHHHVSYVGPKPFDAMPGYMRAIDVGLTPYANIAFNRASFPLKTLEYLAGRTRAVSTDLPAVRWLDTPLIDSATGPTVFADSVAHVLDRPRTPELIEERRSFARKHSWMARAS